MLKPSLHKIYGDQSKTVVLKHFLSRKYIVSSTVANLIPDIAMALPFVYEILFKANLKIILIICRTY